MTRLKGIIYTLCVWIIPSPIIKFGKKNTKTSQKPGAHSSISLSIGSSSLPVEVWNFLGQGSVSKSPRRKSSCRTWRFQEGCKLVEPLGFRTEDWRLIFGNKNIAGWVDATKYYKMLWLILSQLLWTYFVPNFFGWSVWCETVTRTIPRKKGFKVEYIPHIKWPIKKIFMEATFHANNPRKASPNFNPKIWWLKDLPTFFLGITVTNYQKFMKLLLMDKILHHQGWWLSHYL